MSRPTRGRSFPEPLNSAQLLLQYQALVDREHVLREAIESIESKLASDPEVAQRDQAPYSRIRVRPAVARVSGTQCSACRVTVTSSGMQILRKGDALVNCEHCGRILVAA